MSDTFWLAFKVTSDDGRCMEFQGVFSSEERAAAACRDVNWFVAPATLDREVQDEPIIWPGGYYPLADGKRVVEAERETLPVRELQRVNLEAGEVLVVKVAEMITPEAYARLRAEFRQALPDGVKVLLLIGEMELSAIRVED